MGGSGIAGDVVRGEAHRGMVEADGALEAQLGGAAIELGGGDVIAERVAGPADPARLGRYVDFGIENDLVAVVARPQHHAMFTKGHRLPVVVGGDVPYDENRHRDPKSRREVDASRDAGRFLAKLKSPDR